MVQRVLVLHGYLQNSENFSKKLGVLRKACLNAAHLKFLDAPIAVPESNVEKLYENSGSQVARPENPRGWWIFDPNDQSAALYPDGFLDSLCACLSELTLARYDGIFGFSQGAGMATALLLYLFFLEQQKDNWKQALGNLLCDAQGPEVSRLEKLSGELVLSSQIVPFKFGILVSGFQPSFPLVKKLLEALQPNEAYLQSADSAAPAAAVLSLPSLHVFGSEDVWVPPSRSLELSSLYAARDPCARQSAQEASSKEYKTLFRHAGRHFVPTCTEGRKVFLDFLGRF